MTMNRMHRIGVSVVSAALLASIASTALAFSNIQIIPEQGKRESVAYLQADGSVKVTVAMDCTEGEAIAMSAGVQQGKGPWASLGESAEVSLTCDASGQIVQDLFVAPYEGSSFRTGGAEAGLNINGRAAYSRKVDIQ